ncbi:hypothetical protein ANANG_G00319360, partial [Anguilla anguilla]
HRVNSSRESRREKELRDLRRAVQSLKRSAQAAVEDSERIFTELIRSIERRCSEVKELIRDQEMAEVSRAEGLLERLEQEIAELKKKDGELEQLSHTEDHIHFLQISKSLYVPPGPGDLPSITISPHISFEASGSSVSSVSNSTHSGGRPARGTDDRETYERLLWKRMFLYYLQYSQWNTDRGPSQPREALYWNPNTGLVNRPRSHKKLYIYLHGKEVLKLLERAFDQKLVFTVAATDGAEDRVVFTNIPHARNLYECRDYPFLAKVKAALNFRGICLLKE